MKHEYTAWNAIKSQIAIWAIEIEVIDDLIKKAKTENPHIWGRMLISHCDDLEKQIKRQTHLKLLTRKAQQHLNRGIKQ